MFQLKYMDGTPVDPGYAKAIASLVGSAAAATEVCSEDELEAYAANAAKYRKIEMQHIQERGCVCFVFPNDETRSNSCLHTAFQVNGLEIADIQHDAHMWTWVLTTNGDLWLHDKSHGCGGFFSLYQRN